jgi:glucose/mannose-6-phosphate isomerase
MIDLNDFQRFPEIDSQGMLSHALNLPQICLDAWELGARQYPRLELSERWGVERGYSRWARQIVVTGMGGSAIGGDLLSTLVADECPCPILVHRGYGLPAFVYGPEALVIGCSHSGNTEETLSAFEQAHKRGTSLLAITTGGELARLADEWGAPVIRYVYDSQPRAALGYPFILLVSLLCQLGLAADKGDDLAEAAEVMRSWQTELGPEVPLAYNPAKRLAELLMARLPIIYGAGLTEPVARRWKTQFNENAKCWAFFETMPELNHNTVVGYERSEQVRQWANVVMLRSPDDSSRIQTRWRITRQMLLREGASTEEVMARGQNRLAQMLSLIHYGDLVSIYLALASEVDPTPISSIVYLKEQLAHSH